MEPVLGPHARTGRTRNTRVGVPRLSAPEDGRSGEGQRLTSDAPHNSGRPPPPGDGPPPSLRHAAPTGRAGQASWGGTGTGLPPPKHARRSKAPGQDTRRGTDHVERPYQRPVPGPREVRTPHHPGGGGGRTPRERERTHAEGTRGLPEGQPNRARGTHRLRGMVYQRARVRDTQTGRPAARSASHARREGGNGRDTTPGTGPSPPSRPRAPRTHRRGTAPAKAVVAHCATPQPLGKAASARAQEGPTGDKPVARARRRRRPGQPRISGATRWVSACSHGCKLMH